MLTELTFAILKYGFLVLLWIFVACTVRSLYRDVETLSPRKSRAHRRKERRARKAVEAPAPVAVPAPVVSATSSAKPTLLVIIDGPLAGSSVPLSGNTITLGRSAFEHRGSGRRIRLVPPCARLYGSRHRQVGHRRPGFHQRYCGQPAASERSDDSRIARSRTHWRNHL